MLSCQPPLTLLRNESSSWVSASALFMQCKLIFKCIIMLIWAIWKAEYILHYYIDYILRMLKITVSKRNLVRFPCSCIPQPRAIVTVPCWLCSRPWRSFQWCTLGICEICELLCVRSVSYRYRPFLVGLHLIHLLCDNGMIRTTV